MRACDPLIMRSSSIVIDPTTAPTLINTRSIKYFFVALTIVFLHHYNSLAPVTAFQQQQQQVHHRKQRQQPIPTQVCTLDKHCVSSWGAAHSSLGERGGVGGGKFRGRSAVFLVRNNQEGQVNTNNSVRRLVPITRLSKRSMSSKDDQSISGSDGALSSTTVTTTSFSYRALTIVGKSTSALVSVTFFTVLAYKRDAFMLSFFIGSICNAVLGKVLKRILNQERPRLDDNDDDDDGRQRPTDKGMPSSHAMSLGFICTLTALTIPYTALPLVAFVVASLYYRVQTKLHTVEQVTVGLALGSTNGYLWRRLLATTGDSPPPWWWPSSVNVMDVVSNTLVSLGSGTEDGILPVKYLVVPALVGLVVVGSFERNLGQFLDPTKYNEGDGTSSKVD